MPPSQNVNAPKNAPDTPAVQIQNWKTFHKNTLRGFFSATLRNGMVLHDLMLHEKEGKRWISPPSREYKDPKDPNGDTQYSPFLTFTDRSTADRFRDAILAALDQHLAEVAHDGQRQKQRA